MATSEYKKCSKFLLTELCEKDINDCEGHDCQNGGKCVDGIGGYSCFCRRGYEGKRCEISHSEPSESSESSEEDLCASWEPPNSCTELMMEMGSPGCVCDPETGPDLCAGWTAPGTCSADDIEMEAAGCWCDPETGPPDLCADWVAPDNCSELQIEQGFPGCGCDPETGLTTLL